jgi:hypothetical protein
VKPTMDSTIISAIISLKGTILSAICALIATISASILAPIIINFLKSKEEKKQATKTINLKYLNPLRLYLEET